MNTKRFISCTDELVGIMRGGGLVAVPTETVYGLAGNGLDEKAVAEIYEVKGRPEVKPLSLMVHDAASMERYCESVPPQAYTLAKRFWPGPLTIVMKAKPCVPEIVRAGGETVGLRCPDHPLTLELLEKSRVPFAAPSANPSGEPSPKNADSVLKYFDGKIDAVLDGGECGIGRESTLIDLSRMPYRILRQGALPADEIADALVDGMKIIGITGGTGCGKTTALNELERRGALLIDCDAVYHRMLETDRPMLDEIEKYFPGAVVDGKLDRKALGAVVFTDEEALRDLNIITHRHINLEIRRILREHAMNGGTLAAIDAIELFSSGLAKRCTATVGVIAGRDVRISRIMRRDGISREYAMMRVNAQRPNEYFIQNCSRVLENNGSQEEFIERCRKTFEEVL
mgnify:FL=1